jgi:hypothetical protein
MFDQVLPKNLTLPLSYVFQSEFAARLDQFMLHYQGKTIHSIRVSFPLDDEHSDVIDRLITKGMTKGVKQAFLLQYHPFKNYIRNYHRFFIMYQTTTLLY